MAIIQDTRRVALIVAAKTPALAVFQQMNQTQKKCVLVMEQQALIGILTSRDVVRSLAAGIDLPTAAIADLMTQPVITLTQTETQTLSIVLEKLQHHQIRFLPVVNTSRRVLGIVTSESVQEALQQTVKAQTAELEQALTRNQQLADQLTENKVYFQSSAARLNDILNSAIAAIGSFRVYVDRESDCDYCSIGCKSVFGYSPQAFMEDKKLWQSRVLPEDRERIFPLFKESIFAERPITIEYRFRHPDGSIRWISDAFTSRYDAVQHCWIVTTIAIDISDRKQAEAGLRQFERIVSATPDGISLIDLNYTYCLVNQAYLTINNKQYDEIVGHSIAELMGEDVFEKVIKPRLDRCFAGETIQYEDWFHYPTIGPQFVSLTYAPYMEVDGTISGVIVCARRLTEMKQAEAQIKASLREKEILLQEIHHRVKNNLQVVSSLLSLQAERVTNPLVRSALEDSQSRIDSMSLVHDSLYHSNNFVDIRFGEYIQTLASNLFQIYNVRPDRISLRIEVSPDISLNLSQAIPCGLMLNELISNALKHGFLDNRQGELFITFLPNLANQFVLSVGNSGNSLPPGFSIETNLSIGLKLVMSLLEQLEGILEIDQGDPTVFRIIFEPSG
ncbi:PAS domain S-box protein [Kovacikia minuta CCNUW1]|uniref:histidine kinase dimerization/phosphoacceptor domain -containing protein n=1 Tax=Kovacikia minuta TaxID=2931930 RepID=UPI001CCBC557|nr:histidine kinase dimerization/phosphoacceptor domain -containing protein [Kovacikia minuta]UBF25244.1 PAS domain S-box protein [Kovacikia minuta CCNUW1]